MAVDACNCTDGTKGWGLSSCFNKFGYPLGYAFQKLKDSTGADNGLTGTEAAPLTQTAGALQISLCSSETLKDGATVRPIPIEVGTLFVKEMFQTKTSQQKLMVSFQVSEEYNDSDFGFVPAKAIDADLLGTTPQIETIVTGDGNADSNGAETVVLTYSANNSTTPEALLGAGDTSYYEIYNTTTQATVSISSIVDNGSGSYTFDYVGQTPADVLELRYVDGSPLSFDFYTWVEA